MYAVPAYLNEWYPSLMYNMGTPCFYHHLRKYGRQSKFGYKDFIPSFKAEDFDARGWMKLFQDAGARYVVPVAEHHDGFAMYDCSFSDWTSVKMGPRRDIIAELRDAAPGCDITFGLSSHRAEHWWFSNGGRQFPSDVQDPQYESLYGPAQPSNTPPDAAFMDDWLVRSAELVDRYQPQVFWFDWWIEQPAWPRARSARSACSVTTAN